ncbi:MAG: hypothetical protein KBT22_11950 [Bacteroidales bacterium]|nr:hypothetical protein [Candidatus Scybalocola fimicaballi]
MTELEIEIKKYADAYYQGNELISDSDYDALIAKLKKEQPDSKLLNDVVGSDLKGVSTKYKLDATMGTLEKCNTDEEMAEWWSKHPHNNLIAELKIDGNGQLLTYEHGQLAYVRSRGDGEYGDDTTANVSKVQGVPAQLSADFSGSIRGEVVMFRSVFEKHFPEGKNPRNMAAGIIKRLDGKDCEKLNFIAYDLFDKDNKQDVSESGKLAFLKDNGFDIPRYETNPTLEGLKQWKDSLEPNGEIPCDGIVIKQNIVSKEDLMRHTPLNNVAYKPNCQSAVTTVKRIVWQLRGKFFGPVAEVEPVELEGTTVSKASLANVNIMNELGVYEGAEVIMTKHGLIIPQIDKVLHPKQNAFTVPSTCPVCGGDVEVNSSGIPVCMNPACPKKVGHRYGRLFKVFGVKGAGEAFLKNLEDESLPVEDFLAMCMSDDKSILNKYAGGLNGEKIYAQMRDALAQPITASQFLATFDLKLFDEKKLNQLGRKSLDDILSLKYDEIVLIDGYADTTANALLEFLDSYSSEIEALRKFFIFKNVDEMEAEESTESLPSVCFTGACPGYSRGQLTEMAKGKYDVKDAVTKDLSILVCADPNSGSSKLQKAAKNGTKLMSYDEFLATLG